VNQRVIAIVPERLDGGSRHRRSMKKETKYET